MSLIKSRSKKAMSKNIETEMHAGKPQDQAIAIAYSVKRKAKKKAAGGMVESGSPDMNMARGGEVAYKNDSAVTQARPMPSERDNDSHMVSQNFGNKAPARGDSFKTGEDISYQAKKGMKTTKIKHPKMVPQDGYSVRLRDEEDDLQSSASPGPYGEQPPRRDDEEGANRQGPSVPDMQDEHSTHRKPYAKGGSVDPSDSHFSDYRMKHAHLTRDEHLAKAKEVRSGTEGMSYRYKQNMEKLASYHENEAHGKGKYAKGGQIEASDERIHMDGRYEDDLTDLPPSMDEGDEMAMSHNEEYADSHGHPVRDMEAPHNQYQRSIYAQGGEVNEHDMTEQPEDEADLMHDASVAAAIMRKRKYAMGGEILNDESHDRILSHGSMDSDDSDQADLSRNADEDANEEDQASHEALMKENYSESDGLDEIEHPMDSNMIDDPRESDEENIHDRSIVGKIRSAMKKRSPITR